MDTKAVHQFPSPPKARTRGGRRAQTAKEAPAAAAKPPRTRRGAKKQAAAEASAADAEHTDAEPAQLMKPLQDAESADAEAGSAEDQIRTGNAVMTSHDSKESPSLQPGRQQLPDSRAAPTVDSASTQHPTTDSAKAVQSPPSVQISPPTSLTKSSKRKDSPNALSPDPKRQHQEPASAQAAHKPFDSLEPSSAAVGELADQASPMMVDNGNQAPQAQDANLGSSDQHALHSSELLAARSHSAAPASADMVDKTGLSIAVHADLPPEASSEQPELVASVSDSEPEAAADSPASAGQTLSSPVPDHPAREQYGADADKSSPPAPDPPAAQQDDTTHAEPSVEVISPDQVAEGSPQPVPVIPDDLTADTEQHASPPAALSILPAQTEVAKDEAASAQHTQLPVANNATEINLQTAAATALPAVPEAVPAKQALSAVPGNAPEAGPGLGKNLVSAIRSFLPGSKAPEPQLAAGKKPVKVMSVLARLYARCAHNSASHDVVEQLAANHAVHDSYVCHFPVSTKQYANRLANEQLVPFTLRRT